MTAYVGIDLHRRRSLAVCLDEGGRRLWWKRFDNSPQTLVGVVLEAGSDAVVMMEATWGWYWAVDVLADEGVEVHRMQLRLQPGSEPTQHRQGGSSPQTPHPGVLRVA
jgi:hypothetical protein